MFSWENLWKLFCVIVVLMALSFIGIASSADHHVDGYYMSSRSSGVCVYAHWTWHTDESAFCSDSYERALDFAERATLLLVQTKQADTMIGLTGLASPEASAPVTGPTGKADSATTTSDSVRRKQ